MLGASLIVLLGIWCTGSSSQPTVIQESSMAPSPGQTVKLSCSLSSGQVTNYHQSWYQQKEGSPPRFLYRYYSSAAPGSGDLSRFSASKESNQNKWYLTISNVQPEDEADYYCAVWYHPSNVYIFGAGTELSIQGGPTKSPTVTAFSTSEGEMKTFVCTITNYTPKGIDVKWKADGVVITSDVQTSKATKQGSSYNAVSYLRLTQAQCEQYGQIVCEVTHEGNIYSKPVSTSGTC